MSSTTKKITPSRSHLLRFAKKNMTTWLQIKSGKKKVETRAATTKYQKIKAGDSIVCCCDGKKLTKEVVHVRTFKSIPALLRVYKAELINPGMTTLKEMEAMYYSYPGYKEKIKSFGLIALELD